MPLLELSFASGERSLSVERFAVEESLSGLFSVSVWARSPLQDIDFERIVGQRAALRVLHGLRFAQRDGRTWSGVVSFFEQTQVEPTGLASYALRIVPSLWLLTHRRDHRIFQHLSIPDIADAILAEWGLAAEWKLERAAYPPLEYKVQYGETDHAFLVRLFEEAGIAHLFPDEAGSDVTLGDALHLGEPRSAALPFVDNPNEAAGLEYATDVRIAHEVRPEAHVIRDHDFRNPGFALVGEAGGAARLEQYHYQPGAFLIEGGAGGDTPSADDKGVARHDQGYGHARARRALEAARHDRRQVRFATNAIDLAPGTVFVISQHAHHELAGGQTLLVTRFAIEGSPGDAWRMQGEAVFAAEPYRPALRTAKPIVSGVQSAVVVGPAGDEIHTDELGRARVQFPWDRQGRRDDGSSCWLRVSQGWAGGGYGMVVLPRVGQEVLVGFLGGDPDQPIIVGRVYNAAQPVPYKLPDHKTRSTWRSASSPASGGANELLFEDRAGQELVYLQAERDLRQLVKHDATITVGHDRQKLVRNDELETTLGDRTEVVGRHRVDIVEGDRTLAVGGRSSRLVGGDEVERLLGDRLVHVGGEHHLQIHGDRRVHVGGDSHLKVQGDHRERVGGTLSLTAGSLQMKVDGRHGLAAGGEVHLKAGTSLVIEARDVTLKAAGGFVSVGPSGVVIQGTLVLINSGGSAGSGSGASATAPELPRQALVEKPDKPEPDDVSQTGLGQ